MTTREVVNVLTQRGHKIKYRVRKDGGILITSMDGVKYTGASGNTVARSLVGDEARLSQARKTQLKIIKPPKGAKPKEDVLQGRIKTRIKQVQKAYNKNKVPISQGRITKRLIRKIVQEEGMEAAYRKLEQSERYAEGYALSKTIAALVEYIRHMATLIESDELEDLADDIEAHDGLIRDEWIKPAYEKLYELNHGGNTTDIINQVRSILHL